MDTQAYVLKKLQGRTKKKVTLDLNVYELGIDSLELVVLISEVEKELKIKISDETLINIKLVQDIVAAIDEVKKTAKTNDEN